MSLPRVLAPTLGQRIGSVAYRRILGVLEPGELYARLRALERDLDVEAAEALLTEAEAAVAAYRACVPHLRSVVARGRADVHVEDGALVAGEVVEAA